MRGLICFLSVFLLIIGIESFSIWTDIILLAIFWWTSKKYWVKE